MAETVEFNGVKFRRYPEAKQRADRVYYTPGISDKQRGIGRLHEEIWKAAHGPIPAGSHIHHKDENPLNNKLDNLELLTGAAHMSHHNLGQCSDRKRANLDAIRPLTKAWHGSEAGLEWHRQHAYNSLRAVAPTEHTCDNCSATFVAVPKKANRFCSNACKSAWRRKSGKDNEIRVCVVCSGDFAVNRYAQKTTCSVSCRGTLQSETKRNRSGRGLVPGDP